MSRTPNGRKSAAEQIADLPKPARTRQKLNSFDRLVLKKTKQSIAQSRRHDSYKRISQHELELFAQICAMRDFAIVHFRDRLAAGFGVEEGPLNIEGSEIFSEEVKH